MSREYYPFSYLLDGQIAHLIWFSDERDGVFVDADTNVPSFNRIGELSEYSKSRGMSVELADSILLDLDSVSEWLEEETTVSVDCVILLNAWNLFDDVSRSVNGSFDADRKLTNPIYDKLFGGNNLPAVTPEGESYHPTWTKKELRIIREVLGAGLAIFKRCISRV